MHAACEEGQLTPLDRLQPRQLAFPLIHIHTLIRIVQRPLDTEMRRNIITRTLLISLIVPIIILCVVVVVAFIRVEVVFIACLISFAPSSPRVIV
jgi:hypothetical protein